MSLELSFIAGEGSQWLYKKGVFYRVERGCLRKRLYCLEQSNLPLVKDRRVCQADELKLTPD